MENLSIATMPIKPRKKPCIGMCIAPIIKEILANEMNANELLCLNTLHSYENINELLDGSLEYFNKRHLDLSNIFIDSDHKEHLMEMVEKLYYNKILIIKKSYIYRCDCGKVDIVKNGIRAYDNGDLYSHKNGKIVCNKCHTECKLSTEDSLFLRLDESINDDVDIYPFYLEKELKYLSKAFKGQDILISKNRQTGAILTLDGHTFNIDVDFLWMNIPNCIENDNQIFIASNHQLYEMYIMNYLSRLSSSKKLSFIATPYLDPYPDLDPEIELSKINDEYFIKLTILYMLKWKKKNCAWDPSIIKGVSKLKAEERQAIWEFLSNYDLENMSLMEEINQMLGYKISMGRNIKMLRRNN